MYLKSVVIVANAMLRQPTSITLCVEFLNAQALTKCLEMLIMEVKTL